VLLLAPLTLAADLLIEHARVWEATGGAPREDTDVLVQGDRIVAIGSGLTPPEGAHVIDGRGATLLPGLVDSHVHPSFEPGAPFRTATVEQHQALLAAHLRAYVACGVTTVLDAAISPEDWAFVRGALASGASAPRYLTLGPPLSPPHGYPEVVVPGLSSTVATPADVDRALDLLVSGGAIGVKTAVEGGAVRDIWPPYSPEVSEAIRAGAEARGLPLYAHAISPTDQRRALDTLRPEVLLHGLDRPDGGVVARAAAAGVVVVSTLSVIDMMRGAWQPERLADPLVRLVVPQSELATAGDPRTARKFERAMVETLLPRMTCKNLVAWAFARESTTRARLGRQMHALRDLVDAGVEIAMGSDSGAWPLIPYGFHGPTTLREIALLGEAGLTPSEALLASTRTPARMLGIDSDVGTIEVGKIADLLLVEGDPLTDLGALWRARIVVRAGAARTPVEWIGGP